MRGCVRDLLRLRLRTWHVEDADSEMLVRRFVRDARSVRKSKDQPRARRDMHQRGHCNGRRPAARGRRGRGKERNCAGRPHDHRWGNTTKLHDLICCAALSECGGGRCDSATGPSLVCLIAILRPTSSPCKCMQMGVYPQVRVYLATPGCRLVYTRSQLPLLGML
jgi:hypothetical protein